MTNLSDFLLARIAEDEAAASAAGSGPWHWEQGYGEMCNDAECPYGSLIQVKEDGAVYQLMEVHGYDVDQEWQGADHIARHDPARVLAECDAKRQIVKYHQMLDQQSTGRGGEVSGYHATGLGIAIRLLALPYADHPEYDEAWRP